MKNQITILDMLFEKRNKAYGAYELRTKYGTHLMRAFLLGTAPILFLVFSSFIFYRNQPKTIVESPTPIVHHVQDFYLPKERIEPLIKQIEALPKEKPIVEAKRYVSPEPVEDEKVTKEERVLTFKELEDVKIANITAPGLKVSQTNGLFTGVIGGSPDGKETAPKEPLNPTEPEIFDFAETLPSFGKSQKEMYQWLSKHLRYPRAAQASSTEGKVFLAFVVEKDGSISNIKVVKGIGFGCDEEAVEALKKMPKWNPGIQNGKPVRVRFTLPIVFKLN